MYISTTHSIPPVKKKSNVRSRVKDHTVSTIHNCVLLVQFERKVKVNGALETIVNDYINANKHILTSMSSSFVVSHRINIGCSNNM